MGESSRGRALQFEQCESRLALSTTAYIATPGDAQSEPEGGQIPLDAALFGHFFSLAPTRGASTTNFTITAGDGALPIGQGSLGGGDRLNVAAQPPGGLLTAGNVISRDGDPFGAFDQVMGDADFSAPELFGADSTLVGSAIRPISPPTGEAPSNDGGSIALDPFTRPEGLLDLTPAGLNSVAGADGAANGGRVASPRPAATESLRGRAVVFEVAHRQSDISEAVSLRLASRESSNTEVAYLAENDSPKHAAAAAATRVDPTVDDGVESPTPTRNARQHGDSHRDQELSSDDSLMAVFAPDYAPWQSTEATSEQAASATTTIASRGVAHDAALAGWSSSDDGETAVAVAPLDPAVSHRTMVGALLALVAGTAPFSKRFRGLLAKSTMVERPPRRRT